MACQESAFIPRLPQEIAERIIDCTTQGTSLRHLKSFSLVCGAWLPRSRFHLFRRIRVFISQINPDALEDMLALLEESRSRREHRTSKFLPAADFVQELLVSDPFRTKAPPATPISTEAVALDSPRKSEPRNVLNRISNTLPHLRVLELDMRVGRRALNDGPRNAHMCITHLHRLVLSADASPRAILPLFTSVRLLTLTTPMNLVSLDDEPLETDAELEFEHLPAREEWDAGSVAHLERRAASLRAQSKVRVERVVIPRRMLSGDYARALRELGTVAVIQHLTVQGGRTAGTSLGMDDAQRRVLEAFIHDIHPETFTVGNMG